MPDVFPHAHPAPAGSSIGVQLRSGPAGQGTRERKPHVDPAILSSELIDAARAGDAHALGVLLAGSRRQMVRFAERHCVVHDVEDAVQETLILTSRHIGTLRATGAFFGWIFRIVKRECDRLKRAWRLHVHDYAPDQPLPEPVFEVQPGLREDLVAALQSLPSHYREVLLLRDAEDLTVEEMASRLDLTRLAVKARLHRARVLVREYLAD